MLWGAASLFGTPGVQVENKLKVNMFMNEF